MGVKKAKITAAGLIAILAAVNAYAASVPKYRIAGNKITYPYFSGHDIFKILQYPSVLGPTVNAFTPTKAVINCREIMLYGLSGVGTINVDAPVTMLPVLNYGNLIKSSDKPKVTYYGISSKPLEISFPCVAVFRADKLHLLIPVYDGLIIAKGSGKMNDLIGGVFLIGNWKIICILPETAYSGVFTWKPKLRLSSLL